MVPLMLLLVAVVEVLVTVVRVPLVRVMVFQQEVLVG